MAFNDHTDTAITLEPDVPEVEKERMSSFQVYSVPGDPTSTRFDFQIAQLNGNEGVRSVLHWMQQKEKLPLASKNHVFQEKML